MAWNNGPILCTPTSHGLRSEWCAYVDAATSANVVMSRSSPGVSRSADGVGRGASSHRAELVPRVARRVRVPLHQEGEFVG
jgi:hypothetical protein